MFFRSLLLGLAIVVVSVSEVQAQEENPIVTFVKSKMKDKTKPFSITVAFKVKAGQEKAFAEAFGPAIAATRKEQGVIAYCLNQEVDEPAVFVMYEAFKNVAAIESHAKSKHVEELLKKIAPMLDGEAKVKLYTLPAE